MSKTIEQINAMIIAGQDIRQVVNEIANYLKDNPGGGPGNSQWDDIMGGIEYNSGDVSISKNILLDNTVDQNTGIIKKDGINFIHNYADPTSDGENIFLGNNSGNFTLGQEGGVTKLGSRNVGVGRQTLTGLTTGYRNVAVGGRSQQISKDGHYNTSVGDGTMASSIGASYNVAIGGDCLSEFQEGTGNVGIGVDALQIAHKITDMTAVGHNAFVRLTSPEFESAGSVGIGAHAFWNTTFSYRDVGVGTGALESGVVLGGYNTFIGYNAGNNANQNPSAAANIAVGALTWTSRTYMAVFGGSYLAETHLFGQVKISNDATQAAPEVSAKFQVDDPNRGVLFCRGTKAERDAILSPAQGLHYFVTDNEGYLSWYNNGWQKVISTAD